MDFIASVRQVWLTDLLTSGIQAFWPLNEKYQSAQNSDFFKEFR